MVKCCKYCNLEYEAKTSKSSYCSQSCNKKHYYINNLEKISSREKSYVLDGRSALKNKRNYSRHAEKIKAEKKIYRKLNRDKINQYNINYYKDLNNRLRKNLRGRLSCAIRRGFDGSRGGSFVKDLGCSIQNFKLYIESKFIPGMNWNNYGWGEGCWHLDHIIPLISFDLINSEEFKRAAHYTNYQPLWQTDNFKKGCR